MPLSQNEAEIREFDLVVVGGGLSGLCAAIGAAREGARVALVQDRPVFGGNCSSEVRVVPHGANHSNAWAGHTGVTLSLLLEDRASNHEAFPDHGMINSHFDFTLLQAAHREPNLTFLLNTVVRAVDSEPLPESSGNSEPTSNGLGRIGGGDRRILAVHATQMGSEKEIRLVAPQFIDATGDGTVGHLAGADYRYGREARDEFNESLAPVLPDDVTMGATITMRARDVGRPVDYDPPPWIERYETAADIGFKRTLYHLNKPVYGGYWWLEVCNPFHQIDDNPEVRHELHRHVLGIWNYIKNHSEHREQARNYALDWVGMIPGKRESRRLMGDVMMTEHDCHNDRGWPDAIGYAGWWIDLHIKGGILNKKDPGERENADKNYKHWIRIPTFTLPLRAFYSRNVVNLWIAGRCFSTTHVALGPARVMQTLGQLGQSVGMAAAGAVAADVLPREFAAHNGPHLAPYQQRLLRADVRVPGIVNRDPADLALNASATASSEARLDLQRANETTWYWLGEDAGPGRMASPGLGMVVPLTEARLDSVEFYLRSEAEAPQRLQVVVQRLNRIWDRVDDLPIVARGRIEIEPGARGWHAARLDAAVEPGHPYRIAILGGEHVGWAEAVEWPAGTTLQYLYVSSGGPEPHNAHLEAFAPDEVHIPAYRHWRQLRAALAMRTSPDQRPFGAGNVNNGVAWPERLPGLWMSDPELSMPQRLDLEFPEPRPVSSVRLSFDTNLARFTQSEAAFFRAPECVRDFRLLALEGDGWREVHVERGNYQRHRVIDFPEVTTSALRLEVEATNGAPEARLYEFRAYSSISD
ncbi:FAD-dependent oxidoreductase [Sphingomonas lenta]|uniref:FAD-dependent oxidoreductase n=1 Tax=Sphingomonas lenta TaxID=1141887 RepID=A0A2A2SCG6_9SPHN|nr:FAD-dependent oxidoreductase [Sphingomonas lenta]PAX06948.1 hypothetical protein CKY28_12835 [Sphingomonas lenta]